MKIELRNDKAIITGYVNAVGRDSNVMPSPNGNFIEQVEPGTFREALTRAANVDLLINHNAKRKIGSTASGTLKLTEDNIGLRAYAEITDPEAIDKARKGEFTGWSYGMYVNAAEMEQRANNIPRRHLKSIDIFEVSLIDRTMRPCYAGTSVECRADGNGLLMETRSFENGVETVDERAAPDLSEYEERLAALVLGPYE